MLRDHVLRFGPTLARRGDGSTAGPLAVSGLSTREIYPACSWKAGPEGGAGERREHPPRLGAVALESI